MYVHSKSKFRKTLKAATLTKVILKLVADLIRLTYIVCI